MRPDPVRLLARARWLFAIAVAAPTLLFLLTATVGQLGGAASTSMAAVVLAPVTVTCLFSGTIIALLALSRGLSAFRWYDYLLLLLGLGGCSAFTYLLMNAHAQ